MRSPFNVTVFLPSTNTGATWRLARAGQRDADVGELRFAGPVHDTAHDGHVHVLDAGVAGPPEGHLLAQVSLDLVGELLEEGAGGAPAAGTRGDHRRERAQPHGLQDLLRDDDFLRAISTRRRRERDADRVADAFLQQHAHGRRGSDDALGAHAGLGEPQVQRVVAALGERAIHLDEVLHRGDLAREHDAIGGKPDVARELRALQGGDDERLAHHLVRFLRLRGPAVLVHHPREKLRVERAPVHADAHGLRVLDGLLDHRGELVVALRAVAHVARVDAVLVEDDGALGHLREELVAVEVEVAHERHLHAHVLQARADRGHLLRGFHRVDGDAHDLASGARERGDLVRGGARVLRVRVGHGLDEDGRVAADGLVGDPYRTRDAAGSGHWNYSTVKRATATLVCGSRSNSWSL
jgi:hypothetical protein